MSRLGRTKRQRGKDRAVLKQLLEPGGLRHLNAGDPWRSQRGGGALDDQQIIVGSAGEG